MKPLQLGLSIIPVVVIVIGLIGWVVTLRGNIDAALDSIQALKAEYGPAIESIRDRELDTEMADKVPDVVTRQAVVENEMRQIMSDHQGFADALRQLGEAGLITERRAYGDYGK